jgi:hypothetical protein
VIHCTNASVILPEEFRILRIWEGVSLTGTLGIAVTTETPGFTELVSRVAERPGAPELIPVPAGGTGAAADLRDCECDPTLSIHDVCTKL